MPQQSHSIAFIPICLYKVVWDTSRFAWTGVAGKHLDGSTHYYSQLFLHTWYQCCHTSLLPPDKPHVFPHTWWEWSASRSAVCLVCAMSLFLCIRRKNREMKDMQKELDDWATITCEYTQLLSDVCVSHVASLHPHTVSSFTQRSVQQGVDSWHSWAL